MTDLATHTQLALANQVKRLVLVVELERLERMLPSISGKTAEMMNDRIVAICHELGWVP